MSMAALRWARGVRGITGTQKFVLVMLSDMANDYGEAWPTAITLAADCCLSNRAVRDAMDALESVGLIVGDRAVGRATRWRIQIGATPERDTSPPARDTLTQEQRSALPPRRHTQERGAPTQEPRSGGGRNVVQGGRNTVPTEPSLTPIEPSITPNTRAKPAAVNVDLPAWLPPDAWADWCAHRRGRKWTQRAAELAIRNLGNLREAGNDPRAVIEQSIASGWTGLFALKAGGARQQPRTTRFTALADELFPPDDHSVFDGYAERTS